MFYEGQDDLVDILATSMCSVCYNTKAFIEFYILDCGINALNKRLLESIKEQFGNFSIEFIPIDLGQFKGLKGWGPENTFLDCYARLLIPELKTNISKAIYLDSDVIALDDISLLYNIDMEGHALAAAPDLGYCDVLAKNCIENLNVSPNHIFANAGVCIFDCEQWRRENISQHILDYAKNNSNFLQVIIEDLFCVYFNNNNYKRLDLRYCLSDRENQIKDICAEYITSEYIKNEWKNGVIQHLTPVKPWKLLRNWQNREVRNFSLFWFFAQKTPYYAGLLAKYMYMSNESISHTYASIISRNSVYRKIKYKLFGIIRITHYIKGNTHTYKLFNIFTVFKKRYFA